MGFLQGLLGGGKAKGGQTVASALSFQTSSYGAPIPLIYGTNRVAGNILWYGNFQSQAQSASGGGKGGAFGGGGGGKGGGTNYTYSTGVALGLCEGPIQGINNCYVDKNLESLSSLGLSLFIGSYSQTPWSYLSANYSASISVTQNVPNSSPYTVTISSGFLADAGVTSGPSSTPMTPVAGSPGLNQFAYTQKANQPSILTFNDGNAGASIALTYTDTNQVRHVGVAATIPSSPPYTLNFSAAATPQVNLAAYAYTKVSSSPSINQYSVSGNTYSFNAANAGSTVTISYQSSVGNNQALSYHGIAYVASSDYQLGNSPQLPNNNFEVQGVYSNSVEQEIVGEQDTIPSSAYTNAENVSLGAYQISVQYAAEFVSDGGVTDTEGNAFTKVSSPGATYQYSVSAGIYSFFSGDAGTVVNISYTASVGPDADPSLVVADILTNAHYGSGFPSSRVGSLIAYQAYSIATGLLISPVYNQQSAAASMLDDIATNTNSAWVWTSGTLTLVPYGDQTVTANGFTYTAPSAPLYSLTDDDFEKQSSPLNSSVSMNDDPVILTRKRPADQINSVKIECLDRNNQYNPAIIEAKDQALIENFGLRQSTTTQTHMFCNLGAARLSAQLQLQRQGIMNMYSFTLDQRYIVLDPMDIVAISDTNLGLNQQWVRIAEIQENDDGTLSFSAEEYLGNGHAPSFTFQQGRGYTANYNATPGSVNTPVIFEPTDALAGELAVWIAASGQNTALWGGCDVWISTDGNTYQNAGRITGPARQGLLTASLATATPAAVGSTVDVTNTLSVNLAESGGELLSGTQSDALNLNTLCYCDGELLAYQNAALTGNNTYSLTYLVRGAYNSVISAHNSGTQFARLDGGIFKYPYASPLIGSTIYIKLCSFNIYRSGEQNLADVQPYAYTLQGTAYTSPLPDVTGFATAYIAGLTQLIWNPVTDFRKVDYEIRQGSTWNNAQVIGRTPLLQAPILGDGTYWIAAHFIVPNGGANIYSAIPVSIAISGSQITQNVIASYDEKATGFTGTLTNTVIINDRIQLVDTGDWLSVPDILALPDVIYSGGVVSSGTYEIPALHRINVGRVTNCQVIIALGAVVGYNVQSVDWLKLSDIFSCSDLIGVDLGNNVTATPQIRLSQDGSTWGAWQNWIPGSYTAMAYDCQVLLTSTNPNIIAVLTDLTFTVDVPTLVLTGTNVTLLSGGSAIAFSSTFNGGPGGANVPNIQVTILNAQAGDDAIISSVTTAGMTLQVTNGGVGVVRSVNWTAEGY